MFEENNTVFANEPTAVQPASPIRIFSFCEMLLSWFCLALGYIFCRVFPVHKNSLGGLVYVLLLFAVSFFAIFTHKYRFSRSSAVVFLVALISSFSLFLSANPFLHFFSYCFCLGAFIFFVATITKNTSGKLFSSLILVDFLKAVLMPFYSIGVLFAALFSDKMKRSKKALLKLFLGLVVALVPTTVILFLLSYDSQFTLLLSKLFNFSIADVFSHLLSLLFGVPLGMYIFGLFVSAFEKRCQGILTEECCRKSATSLRFLPAATAISAATPPLVIYIIFFVSQWSYYTSGFNGVLPGDMTYADYAREGFFQLCTVSVINLAIIFFLGIFMRRKTQSPPITLRIITLIYAFFTLSLISTATAKMIMYINTYGLTPKRVYSSWLMAVIAIIFVLVIIKQFALRFKLLPSVVFAAIICFSLLSLSNTDAIIAKYNVEKYLQGDLKTIDVNMLDELGDCAVPQIAKLVTELDKKNGTVAKIPDYKYEFYVPGDPYDSAIQSLYGAALRLEDPAQSGLFSYTLPKIKAKNSLKKIGFIK